MNKQDIELKFYNLLRRNMSISQFERWIYEIDEDQIDSYFSKGFYFDLASLNYRNKYAINEIEKLILSKVPLAKLEEMKIKDILECIAFDKGNLVDLIEELYDLYCDGYSFLGYLGLSYAYSGIPREHETYNFSEQSRSNLKSEAQRILHFINDGKIVITGKFEYKDYRTDEEKVEPHKVEMICKQPNEGVLRKIVNKICRTIR